MAKNHPTVTSHESQRKNVKTAVENTNTDSCPTKNKKCASCGKLNHLAHVCRTNPPESAKLVTYQDTDEEDGYVYTVGRDTQPMCRVEINGKQVEMMVDSGASVDLVDECTFNELYKGKEEIPTDTKRKIFSYGFPTPLPLL